MYNRELYLTKKFIGCTLGAVQGKPVNKINPLTFSPAELPKAFSPHPPEQDLLSSMVTLIRENPETGRDQLPWSSRKINLQRLFCSLVTFTDDHQQKVAREYFPITQSLDYIEQVFKQSNQAGRPLYLDEQFGIGLKLADNHPLAAAILCHSASRAIGRNRDQRVSSRFIFEDQRFHQWGEAVARFDSQTQYDPPGDTYHFWATCSMGMALGKGLKSQLPAVIAYGTLFYFGADIMDHARKLVARNPLHYKHREVDRLGLSVGFRLTHF